MRVIERPFVGAGADATSVKTATSAACGVDVASSTGARWWLGVCLFLAATLLGLGLLPDLLLLIVGVAVPLGGGALFGYRGRSILGGLLGKGLVARRA
jgi:hypothetical protein